MIPWKLLPLFFCSSLQLRPFSWCQLQLVCCTCDKLWHQRGITELQSAKMNFQPADRSSLVLLQWAEVCWAARVHPDVSSHSLPVRCWKDNWTGTSFWWQNVAECCCWTLTKRTEMILYRQHLDFNIPQHLLWTESSWCWTSGPVFLAAAVWIQMLQRLFFLLSVHAWVCEGWCENELFLQ